MKFPRVIAIAIALLAVAVAVRWFVGSGDGPDSQAPARTYPSSTPTAAAGGGVDAALAAVNRATGGEGREAVADLRTSLMALPPEQAVGRVRQILESGTDRRTGSEFELGPGGDLRSAPTLRTMLLDLVASIDPEAAAAISREILAAPTSADEWAIALRNIGRFEDSPEALELLENKAVELIRNPEWQADPSIGYLNAFDVLVHTAATDETPLLSGLIQDKERPDLAHAAFLTLDRLVQRRPVEMLEQLTRDDSLVASRPEMTAQQIARADLRDDRQRELVAEWLLSPERTATELNAFAGVFPNHNQFVSDNLLTRDTPFAGAELAAHDRAVLGIVTAWQNDARFSAIESSLQAVVARLENFVSHPSAVSSPPVADPP